MGSQIIFLSCAGLKKSDATSYTEQDEREAERLLYFGNILLIYKVTVFIMTTNCVRSEMLALRATVQLSHAPLYVNDVDE